MNRRAILIYPIMAIIFSNLCFGQSRQYKAPAGGGEYKFNTVPELTELQQNEIQERLNKKINSLKMQKGLFKTNASPATIKFTFPLKATDEYRGYSFYGISNFVDHDSRFSNLLDYTGGARTYDLSGYNHAGTDFFLWPFSWNMMDSGYVQVVAAYPGVIIEKADGNYDRNCKFNNGDWNAVYILHADNTVAWYGHLRKNSLTTKKVGDPVEAGEYLGLVGSSGNSTGPHLHLEIHTPANNVIDPFFGPFNPSVIESWWEEQREYWNPQVNRLMTHGTDPVFGDCGEGEAPNEKNIFAPGDRLYVAAYYQDQRRGMQSDYKVLGPDERVLYEWDHSISDSFYAASGWYWYIDVPVNAETGIYKFNVTFNGKEYTHNFKIGSTTGIEEEKILHSFKLNPNYPNPFNPSTVINYEIPEAGKVELKVFDVLGKEISTLVNTIQEAGNHEISFDAAGLSAGVYLCKLSAGKYTEVRKMILAK